MKNKFILGAILGIFLIGIVSAGITGYVLELRKKMPVSDDNLGITSVQSVRGNTATFTFTNPDTGGAETLSGTEGQTLTTSSGTLVQIQSAIPGNLFRKASVKIKVVKPIDSPNKKILKCGNTLIEVPEGEWNFPSEKIKCGDGTESGCSSCKSEVYNLNGQLLGTCESVNCGASGCTTL